VHPENPDGLLNSEDKERIQRVQEQILEDRKNKTNKVGESIAADAKQLQDKLNQKRNELEQ
jgi:hypothetical protein